MHHPSSTLHTLTYLVKHHYYHQLLHAGYNTLTMRKNTVPLNSERQLFAFAGAKSKPLEKFLGCSSLCAGISQRLHHYASALRGHGTPSSYPLSPVVSTLTPDLL